MHFFMVLEFVICGLQKAVMEGDAQNLEFVHVPKTKLVFSNVLSLIYKIILFCLKDNLM